MLKNFHKQQGNAHVVIVIIILVVILASLGYVFWRNLSHKSSDNSLQTSSKVDTVDSSDYLVVGDWNVKFKISNELKSTQINFYQRQSSDQNSEAYYAFTTTRIQALGGACATQPFGDTQILYRHSVKPIATPDSKLLNSEPLGGYYFVLSSPQAPCTTVDADGALAKNTTALSTEKNDRTALRHFALLL